MRGEPISSGDVAVYPGDARTQDSPSGVFEVALRQALQHEQGRYDQACELERHVDPAHFRAGSAHDYVFSISDLERIFSNFYKCFLTYRK